jgi:hypothetical protein
MVEGEIFATIFWAMTRSANSAADQRDNGRPLSAGSVQASAVTCEPHPSNKRQLDCERATYEPWSTHSPAPGQSERSTTAGVDKQSTRFWRAELLRGALCAIATNVEAGSAPLR